MSVDMRVRLGELELANPVVTAAGCAGSGRELAQFFDITRIGAVTTKSVMVEPRAGNPAPRMAETPSGMLHSVGMQGPGLEVFLQRDLPWLLSRGGRTVVSVAGGGPGEFAVLARRLSQAPGVGAVEINLASANLADRGRPFACDPRAAAEVVRTVREETRPDIPVLAKLSGEPSPDPDGSPLLRLAGACVAAGADGLSMVNPVRAMTIDTTLMRPAVSGDHGGLSGPAIRPLALACVYDVHAAHPGVPIIGMGGVRTGDDALQFLLAGATAVGVGTAIFHDPSACVRILRELEEILEERGVTRVAGLVGAAHRPAGAERPR